MKYKHGGYMWNTISDKWPPRLCLQAFILLTKFSMTFWHNCGLISLIARLISSFNSRMVWGSLAYTFPFRKPQRKKSNGVKSHDLGGQFTSPRREITRPWNFVHHICSGFLQFLRVARSCTSPWLNLNTSWCQLLKVSTLRPLRKKWGAI